MIMSALLAAFICCSRHTWSSTFAHVALANHSQQVCVIVNSNESFSMYANCLQIGITLVGTSSLLGGEGSSTHEISPQKMVLGMGLIIASQVCHANRTV